MQSIGWKIDKIGKNTLYIKSIPLLGKFAKLHRPQGNLSYKDLQLYKRTCNLRELAAEPDVTTTVNDNHSLNINTTPYLPTKTIVIDLTVSEETLLKRFVDSKKRGIKKAEKAGVEVIKGTIEDFAFLKQKDYVFPLGYFMKKDLQKLYGSFPDENKCVLTAVYNGKIIASVLLFFFDKRAYYWQAVTTNQGRKLHAPTLLVWYALREAKKRNCSEFDFDGVYDSRFTQATKRWKGFTKFKEGFGGKEIVFPEPFLV
jgi:lipid II:glycine glycyltransferase (peptidoglycan interpeptide bridge formation enzyme)